MKRYIIISLLLCMVTAVEGFSQSDKRKFYYAYDKKIYLHEVENKFIITCSAKYVSSFKKSLSENKGTKLEWVKDSICIVQTDASQNKLFRENIQSLPGIKSFHPMYRTYTSQAGEMGITDEFVIKPKGDAPIAEIEKLHKKYQVTVKSTTSYLSQVLSVPAKIDALEIANLYQESGLVVYSQPGFTLKVNLHQTIPDDPYFQYQFYLHNTGQTIPPYGHYGYENADINAPEAWDITKGDSSIVVAVIDMGVSSDHPDLPNSRQIRLPGSNFASGDPDDPSPGGDNHGNACAGIIAASHNNEGIAGIAPNCKIMPVRVPSFPSVPEYAAAINFAVNNGADIISNSWAFNDSIPNCHPEIVAAIQNATTNGRNGKGCVVVFSAGNSADIASGNSGFIEFPSNVTIPGVLTVGASDRRGFPANYTPKSNPNDTNNQIIDIVAPSHRAYSFQISDETYEVWTIDIPGDAGYNPVTTDDTGYTGGFGFLPVPNSTMPDSSMGTNYLAYTGHFGGTSASAPQVAGVAALILSRNPYLTQLEVANIITEKARKDEDKFEYQTISGIPNGTWHPLMGHGVLDAYEAVLAACPDNPNLTNQTIATDTTVNSCNDINVQDVDVTNNAKLQLNAVGKVVINGRLEIGSGSKLEMYTGQ